MKKLLSLLTLFIFPSSVTANDQDFWKWFLQNQSKIEALKNADDPILAHLLEQLHKYNEHLFLELSTNAEEKELVITAEGDSEHFESVRNLIATAPKLKNWKFTAFRPPLGFALQTKYEGVEYDPAKLWFLPLENESNPSAVGIKIGIPSFDEKVHEHSTAAAWIILDTALGELVSALEIQYMETGALPADPAKEGYIELVELPDYLAWKKNKNK